MDNGKRIITHILVVGLCGLVKGFDKELEKDSLMGLGNSGSSVYLEKRTDLTSQVLS